MKLVFIIVKPHIQGHMANTFLINMIIILGIFTFLFFSPFSHETVKSDLT